MTEVVIWDVVKTIVGWVVVPLLGALMYFVKKSFQRIEVLDKEIHEQKVKTAVIESKVDDIRDDIKEIKYNVEKLVGRK